MERVKIVECPRDAWQGLLKIIPSDAKISYLRKLIELGFRNLDAVSFVAPKYVPQMADSEAVMLELSAAMATGASLVDPENRTSKDDSKKAGPGFDLPASSLQTDFIGIVVNEQGLERALRTPGVTTIGYPYSISANFRRQNANMGMAESRALVEKLQKSTQSAGRNLVVYISMAFGNPFDEPWSPEFVDGWQYPH
jgi:hydroxymethylglutaryl-CoA lyase